MVNFTSVACEIFSCIMWDQVPQPGIKPGPLALAAWSLSHWMSREVLLVWFELPRPSTRTSTLPSLRQQRGCVYRLLSSLEPWACAQWCSGYDWFFCTHTCPHVLLVPLEAVILGEMGFVHVISDYFILCVGLEPLPAFVSAVTAAWSLPYLFSFFF